MHIGFIGTGVITKAVVTGLIRSGMPFDRITLSPRSATTAAELATRGSYAHYEAALDRVLKRIEGRS